MKYKIIAFNAPNALVEYSTEDGKHSLQLNVRVDLKSDGALPTGSELDDYILSYAPNLGAVDPYAGVDWSGIEALVDKSPERVQAEINNKALMYLAETDWYVVRFAETGVQVPADVMNKRSEARASIVH